MTKKIYWVGGKMVGQSVNNQNIFKAGLRAADKVGFGW